LQIVVAFSWTRAAVRFQGSRLVLKPSARVGASELPEIAGGWMRLAGLKPTPTAIAGFSSTYGLLRREGETLADWREAIEVFAYMGAPWGRPDDLRCREMPVPGPEANAARKVAHYHAQIFGHRAFREDLYPELGEAGATWGPVTLAGFLFLQALDDTKRSFPSFRRCLWCRGWFAVGRADQQFCIPKHRALHHYHTKEG
jgi:hypothetical protein